jgi:alkylated DNA repair dioxygenase AlkB
VLQVRARLLELFPASPVWNTCLLNRYRDGNDTMGWHSDEDVRRYGEEPHICSVSFGFERVFRLRRNSDHTDQVDFTLGGGAVLLMHGKTQKFWQHSLPKRSGALERINLTFRHIRNVVV